MTGTVRDLEPSTDLTSDHPWPRAWTAHWVAAEPQPDAGNGLPDFDAPPAGVFARTLFRTTLALASVPASVPVRVTADSRYELFVNGTAVGRGPVRSQPRRQRYDSYDVASLLQMGENRIVALVTYYGTANSFWQPAPGTGNFGRVGVLALELALPGGVVGTDADWEVLTTPAWGEAPRGGMDGVPVECLDARLVPADWALGGGDGWRPAEIQSVTHLGGLARSCAPTDPYGALLPRPVGSLGREVVRPTSVAIGRFADAPAAAASPVDRVLEGWASVAGLVTADAATAEVAAGEALAVEIDFGRVVAGRVAFDLTAPAGTTVDLLYREAPDNPEDTFAMSVPRTGARYIARGGSDSFRAQESNGLRYAQVIVTPPEATTVSLEDFHVVETLQAAGTHTFTSSDPRLDALYRAGVRTVQVNAADAYTDCPTREQRAWTGDGVVHQLVTLTTSDDWRMARWYVELANSPRPDGILPMSIVGEVEHSQTSTIPDWSLYWVHGVANLLRYTGDAELLGRVAPTVRRVLEWYVPYLDERCRVTGVPEWNLVDWSSILLTGHSSILTALWANALREYAEIADFLGNTGDARWARNWYERARAGYETFWDAGRGTYLDHIDDSEPGDAATNRAASQLAGALAVVSGLAPSERWERVLAWLSDPERQVVRSWIGGHGGYDISKILDQVRGVQRVDWDAEAETVIAQPFASFLVHDACAKAGRPDLLVANLRRWDDFLHDGYDTLGECWGWGTPAHGWSSTPARDLVQVVLGIIPAAPGFTQARIAPAYRVAERLGGSAPTPFGPIAVNVSASGIDVSTPVPATVVLRDGSEVEVEPGRHTFVH